MAGSANIGPACKKQGLRHSTVPVTLFPLLKKMLWRVQGNVYSMCEMEQG